ncbi:MAG: RusA family crossover junction endodeoxyribonuclease [Desulfitobacteriaceae bacterium]
MPMAKVPTATHQEKQVRIIYKDGKPIPQYYEPEPLKAVRNKLEAHLARHIPKQKYTKAIRLVIKWLFPITGKHYDGEWKTTKPDCSNSIKLPEDIMAGLGFFTNDAIVASLVVEKFWSKTPGIYVCIEDLENG